MSQKGWFIRPRPKAAAKLRLFCFPYAGGGISTYIRWASQLPDEVELVCVQPPGRGPRLMEPAYDNMKSLADAIMEVLPRELDRPYVFFGHSLGSRVAFELICRLTKVGLPLPLHYIPSGGRAPHMQFELKNWHELSDAGFKAKLKDLNGTPQILLDNAELMDMLMPLLRADFKIADQYRAEKFAISCPVTALGGSDDSRVKPHELAAWQELTSERCEVISIEGDHFFVESNSEAVLLVINQVMGNFIKVPSRAVSEQSLT